MIFLLVPAVFIRGRRLFEGGVYSREAFVRIITVRTCNFKLESGCALTNFKSIAVELSYS